MLILSAGLFAVVLAACGGGGGSAGTSAINGGSSSGDAGGGTSVTAGADTGSVTLLVTDAPTDLFSEINFTILRAEIFSDEGRQTLFEGEKTIDLLQLEDVTEVLSVTEVPPGYYGKIRLTLSQIELVFKEEGRDPVHPRLPGNGKVDLNPRGETYVDKDNPLTVEIDVDAQKSIHIVQTGKAGDTFNFRPVIFIKKVEGEFDTKLIRQSGYIANLDAGAGTFDLCLEPGAAEEEDLDERDCIAIDATDAGVSVFNQFAASADLDDMGNGDYVTVVGRMAHEKNEDGDDDEDEEKRIRTILFADVIWPGNEINRSKNIACSVASGDPRSYSNTQLPLPEEERCMADSILETSLSEGTKIYDDNGESVNADEIEEGVFNTVDGYLDASGEVPVLRAVVVMLDEAEDDDESDSGGELEGEVASLDEGSLVLLTDVGDRCVIFNDQTAFHRTDEDDEGTSEMGESDASGLAVGQELEAYGEVDTEGCLVAETIIFEVEDDDADEQGEDDEDG